MQRAEIAFHLCSRCRSGRLSTSPVFGGHRPAPLPGRDEPSVSSLYASIAPVMSLFWTALFARTRASVRSSVWGCDLGDQLGQVVGGVQRLRRS